MGIQKAVTLRADIVGPGKPSYGVFSLVGLSELIDLP